MKYPPVRSPCVSVSKERAEEFIRYALRNDIIRKDLKIRMEGENVVIPVKECKSNPSLSVYTSEFESREQERGIMESVESIVGNRPHVGWERLGGAIIFNRYFSGIEKVSEDIVSRSLADQVYVNEKKITSDRRKPQVKLLYGSPGNVIIRENGVKYVMNPSQLMFSKGNVVERGMQFLKNRQYNNVLDMFAGIGYFTLPLAIRDDVKHVTAIDINETALAFLREAARLNKVQEKIAVVQSDCRVFRSDILFDLVIMGNFKCLEYMVHGLRMVKDGGSIIFHHLEESTNISASVYDIAQMGKKLGYNLSLCNSHIVKSYSPHLWHLSSTFTITRRY